MINGLDMLNNMDKYINMALEEDISSEDITTMAVMGEQVLGKAELICKEKGILAGLPVFKRVFDILGNVEVTFLYKEGSLIHNGDKIAELKGDMRNILIGERTALNFLQRISGIATNTKKYVDELEGLKAKVLDTRKTTPNMRIFEKYAVKIAGGCNHRFNLSDGVLIKDNHIGAAGSIKNAVERARSYNSFVRKIEVEVENLDMIEESINAKVDIIMLDNMDIETMKKAVHLINGRSVVEASGNITLKNIRDIGEVGVDFISVGALTHSAPILDFSLKNLIAMNN